MIWHMNIGTWMYYFLLPWGTFAFSVIYGVYWYAKSKKKDRNDVGRD